MFRQKTTAGANSQDTYTAEFDIADQSTKATVTQGAPLDPFEEKSVQSNRAFKIILKDPTTGVETGTIMASFARHYDLALGANAYNQYLVTGNAKFEYRIDKESVGYATVLMTDELLDPAILPGAEFIYKTNGTNTSSLKPNAFYGKELVVAVKKLTVSRFSAALKVL